MVHKMKCQTHYMSTHIKSLSKQVHRGMTKKRLEASVANKVSEKHRETGWVGYFTRPTWPGNKIVAEKHRPSDKDVQSN